MNSSPELETKKLYPYVLENLDMGIWAVDKAGEFIYFNKAMEEMTGVRREDVLGQNLFSIFGRMDKVSSEFKTRFFEAQKSLEPRHYENLQFTRPDGSTAYQYGTFCPMKDENGELMGMITIVEDVTEKIVPRRKEGRDEVGSGSKDILLDVVMSDLLNPLSVILAYTEVMMEEETQEDRMLDLKTIRESAEKMSKLLKELTWEDILEKINIEKREKH